MPVGGSFYGELREGSIALIKEQAMERKFSPEQKIEFKVSDLLVSSTFKITIKMLSCSIQPCVDVD